MNNFDIDDEVQHFIQTMNKMSNNLSTNSTIEQQRKNSNAACRHFFSPYPAGIESFDDMVVGRHGNIPVRCYQNKLVATNPEAQIIFLHGGGFILGDLNSHDDICAELCANTGLNTVSIDYRLAPEHRHPVHLDDVADAFDFLWKPNSIVVAVSAGATLAAALAHRLKKSSRKPLGQVLIYPSLGGDLLDLESYRCNSNAPLLTTEDILYYRKMRCGDAEKDMSDPEFYPLIDADVEGLPPTVAFSADIDPLRDDAALYVDRLSAAGIHAHCQNEAGLTHDYLRARHSSEKAGQSFQRIGEAILLLSASHTLPG